MYQSRLVLGLVALSAVCGCQTRGLVEPLPHFDAAQEIAPRSAPKIFQLRDVSPEILPPMVPFARIALHGQLHRATHDLVVEMATSLGADVVDVVDLAPRFWGIDGSPNLLPDAIVPAQSVAERAASQGAVAVCYRVSPGDLGIRTNRNQMVLVLENESARRAGLLEGDTLLSLDGIPYDPPKNSDALYSWRLAARPGDEVTLAWDRVGEGRMEGQAMVLPTTSDYLNAPDVTDHFLALKQQASLSRTRGF